MTGQTLWLEPDETKYEAVCRACIGDLADGTVFSLAARTVKVVGTLPETAEVVLASCGRGHRIVVRRAADLPLAAAR